ncbi:hypothetical protein DPMN_141305 [Dreissena polymorpha]|uniref:Uncharacterized protein n=1 Tax=Dreissena polymorpha TaxID=45954 RepID=A0A9D4G9Q5_DREPO|nr:hypothetical protein DPMN_141305 [Dreissena polymorpha]
MSFGGGQAVPESWSVYRMIHLLDSAGVQLDSSTLTDLYSKAGQLLWAWLMIFRMLPQVELPFLMQTLISGSDNCWACKSQLLLLYTTIYDTHIIKCVPCFLFL